MSTDDEADRRAVDAARAEEGGAGPGPEAQAYIGAAFRESTAILLVVGLDWHVAVANPAMVRATGWSERELQSRPFWELYIVPEQREQARADVTRFLAEGRAEATEGDWVDRQGRRRRVSLQMDLLHGDDGAPIALSVVGVDVTEQRRREAALRRRAETDSLTGLANRGALFEALELELAAEGGRGVALFFCDLDGLKQANDRYGHHAGDTVLVEVARRLRAATGQHDLVSRFGGDEFVVVVPGLPEPEVAATARRLEVAVARPVVVAPTAAVEVGVSIGTATGAPGEDPDDVVRAADRGMYRVKTARRTRGPR